MPETAILIEAMCIHRKPNKDREQQERQKKRKEKKRRHVEDGILWFLGINRAVVTDTSLMLRDSLVMPKNRVAAWAAPLRVTHWPWEFV